MARLDGVVHDTAGPSEDFFQDLPTAANEEEGKEQEEQEATVAPDEPIPPPTSSATEGVAKEEERERGAIGQPATRTLKPLTTQRRGAGATTTVTRGAAVGEHTTEASSEGRLTASGIGGTTAASVPVLQVDVAALLQGMEAALQQLNTTPAGAPVVTDSVTPEEEQSTSAGDSKRPRHRKHGHAHERDGASGRHRRKKRGSDGKPSKVETPHGPPLSSAEDEVADDGSFEVMEA